MQRRTHFARRSVDRPNRRWISLNTGFTFSGITTGGSSALLNMEQPTNPTALTSALPDDLTIMRIRGELGVVMTADGSWTLAMLVADSNWTPGATFADDADKRILWSRTFEAELTGVAGATAIQWLPPGWVSITGTASIMGGMDQSVTTLDIAPKVKLEAGKTLFLVAYENAGAAAFTAFSRTMRALVQTSRRR